MGDRGAESRDETEGCPGHSVRLVRSGANTLGLETLGHHPPRRSTCDPMLRATTLVFLLTPWLPAQLDWTPAGAGPDGACVAAYDVARDRLVVTNAGRDRLAAVLPVYEWDGSIWVRFAPTSGPSPRSAPAMAFDVVRNVVMMFGGSGTADQWEWDGTRWTQRQPAVRPPGREQPVMVTDPVRRRIVLHGGANRGDTWEWDGAAWIAFTPSASPGARAYAAAAYAPASARVVLFSGRNQIADTWEWDGSNWSQRAATGPTARFAHTMASAPNGRVLMVGGVDLSGYASGDLHEWDGTTWRTLATNVVAPRTLMAAAARPTGLPNPAQAFFVGGAGSNGADLADAYRYQTTWDQLGAVAPPAGGIGTAATIDSTFAVPGVFVGLSPSFWVRRNGGWSGVSSLSVAQRVDASVAHDPTRNLYLVYGGANPAGYPLLNDLWGADANAFYALGTGPVGIRDAGFAWHPLLQRLLLTGGWIASPLPPNYALNTATWSLGTTWQSEPITVAAGVPFGDVTRLVFDAERQEMLAFTFTQFAGQVTLTVAVLRSNQWVSLGVAPYAMGAIGSVTWDPPRRRIVLVDPAFSQDSATLDLIGTTWQTRTTPHRVPAHREAWAVGTDTGVLLALPGTTSLVYQLAAVDAAAYAGYAPGCAGSTGAPQLAAASLPWLGSTWSRQLEATSQAVAAALLVGVSSSTLGSLPLPIDLTGFGMPGCRLATSADVSLALTLNQGRAIATQPIPNVPSLRSVFWFEQCLVLDPQANAAGATLTPARRVEVGER
jgi:hypothetical protein